MMRGECSVDSFCSCVLFYSDIHITCHKSKVYHWKYLKMVLLNLRLRAGMMNCPSCIFIMEHL